MNSHVNTPCIIKETSSGPFFYQIQDDMLLDREIECVGEILADSANSIIRQIRYLAKQDPEAEITIYINSPGGDVASGMALCDVMKAVKCPIRTVCIGTAASMGAVLLACGDRREILPHAKVMIHDPLIPDGPGGSALKVKSISDSLMKTRESIAQFLANQIGRTTEEILEKTANDTWFTAQEAVEFGFVHRIINQL